MFIYRCWMEILWYVFCLFIHFKIWCEYLPIHFQLGVYIIYFTLIKANINNWVGGGGVDDFKGGAHVWSNLEVGHPDLGQTQEGEASIFGRTSEINSMSSILKYKRQLNNICVEIINWGACNFGQTLEDVCFQIWPNTRYGHLDLPSAKSKIIPPPPHFLRGSFIKYHTWTLICSIYFHFQILCIHGYRYVLKVYIPIININC